MDGEFEFEFEWVEGDDNIIFVPSRKDDIDEFIQEYALQALDCKTLEDFQALFNLFFEEVSARMSQDMLVDDIRYKVELLKILNLTIDNFRDK